MTNTAAAPKRTAPEQFEERRVRDRRTAEHRGEPLPLSAWSVLLDAVPGNGESWFLGRCFRLLRQLLPEVQGVLSYCDPLERRDAQGHVVKRGHIGTVYKAFNGRYAGRSAARTLLLSADGRSVNERTLSKIRLGEQGAGYAIRQLQALGAPAPRPGEAGPAYVARAVSEGGFRKVRHPGNLAFTWRLPRGHVVATM